MLRHRPLLWLAPAIALGCASGPIVAASSGAATRDSAVLWLPLIFSIPALLGAFCAWRGGRADAARVACFGALALFCAAHSARRVVPPAGNVREIVRTVAPAGPQKRVPVILRGWVADHPTTGDFKLRFSLECNQVTVLDAARQVNHQNFTGRVWVQAPLDVQVEVGDEVQLKAELADLPRPGNPGERSRHMQFILANCWCLADVDKARDVSIVQMAARYPVERWIAGLRRRLATHYERAFVGASGPAPARPYPHATAQLLSAMVFGEGGLREPLPRLIRDQFRAAGLSHVLVASGTQVSFLALLLIFGARAVGLRRWWLMAAVLPLLLLYALITGGAASIWRATIGGLCLAWALLAGRDIDGMSLWSLALGSLLLIDTAQLFSLSFQLTFTATWGLIVLAPVLRQVLQRLWGRNLFIDMAALTLGAQLAVAPLIYYHFGRFSVVGMGVNLLGVPIAGLLVATGIAGLILPSANLVNYPLTRGMAGLAATAATAPGAQVETAPLTLTWTLLCYVLLAGAALALARGVNIPHIEWRILRDEFRRWWRYQRTRHTGWRPQSCFVGLVLLLTVIVAWRTARGGSPWLRVTVLDVGQGESIIVTSPAGRTVLIDGGTILSGERGEIGRAVIVPYLQSSGVSRIDALVITHADADHCNALAAVLREVPVGVVIDGAAHRGVARALANDVAAVDYQQLKIDLRRRHIPVHAAQPGQRLNLGDGISMTVLAPVEPPLQGDNDNSAVLRLDYGATSFLLTGDIERAAEERLVRRGADLRCTVLKVAHHGSKTSTSPLLLRAAQPQVAVLSCGRYNKFGHPAPQTLQRLAQRRVPVYRTDVHGAIEIYSDGRACWIQTFR